MVNRKIASSMKNLDGKERKNDVVCALRVYHEVVSLCHYREVFSNDIKMVGRLLNFVNYSVCVVKVLGLNIVKRGNWLV